MSTRMAALALATCVTTLGGAALPAWAQQAGAASGSGAAATSAKPRTPQPGAARKATAAAGAAAAAAATATALTLADEDQRKAYALTHIGDYECEFKHAVKVLAHPTHEGYVNLHFDKKVVTAKPVLSSTGAIRLEDVRGQFMMLQIAFKSMLMDTRNGRRVADECLHDEHVQARQRAAGEAPAPGLGISSAPQAEAPNPSR